MQMVKPEDLEQIINDLAGAEVNEYYNHLLWWRENENCIAMYNADNVRHAVNVSDVGTAVRLRLGNPENIDFADDTLQMILNPGEAAVLQKMDGFPLGLYKDNVYLDCIPNGEVTVRGTNGKPCYVACYATHNGIEELVELTVAEKNAVMSFSGQNISKIKLMGWETLQPYVDVKTVERTYSK